MEATEYHNIQIKERYFGDGLGMLLGWGTRREK
jgi:hypothetical protein